MFRSHGLLQIKQGTLRRLRSASVGVGPVSYTHLITCDDRISKLLKYKLSGRGIGFCELLEADFM